MRVLYVSGEVAPFTSKSEIADLVRHIPEFVHENHEVETRIMMPRYGLVSERRNRLHEVIRLSDNEVNMGDETEQLKVKVASIPGIRLQVYFMDSAKLFKRKGIFADRKSNKLFEDNPERAVFFARSVLRTIVNLGWRPDVVHAFGWMSGCVPYLLKTEFSEREVFADSKVVFTPQSVQFDGAMPENVIKELQLPADDRVPGADLNAIGVAFADATIATAGEATEDGNSFSDDQDANGALAMSVYESVQSGVPA